MVQLTRIKNWKPVIWLNILLMLTWHAIMPSHAKADALRVRCIEIDNTTFTPYLAKLYAKSIMHNYGWNNSEYKALVKLWNAESNWRNNAFNKVKVNGENAGGIPQILGLDPATPAPEQIARGLDYIEHRYGKPSVAWAHHRKNNWY